MPLKTFRDEPPSLNLTSMIDVLFLLIIFFMVGTQFSVAERKLGLQVPKVDDVATLSAQPERRIINVYSDGTVALDDDSMSLSELTDSLKAIKARGESLGVLIRGDAQANMQQVAPVLKVCIDAKVDRFALSVAQGTDKAR